MLAGLFHAAGESMRAMGSRRDTRPLDPGAVTGFHALVALLALLVVQMAILLWSVADLLPDALPALLDLTLVTLTALAVPLLVVVVAARLARQPDKIPMLVMFIALALILIQLLSLAFTLSGFRAPSAISGVIAVFVGRAVYKVLGISLGMAILAGVLAGAGVIAAGFLLLALPTGQALLDAA